MEVIQSDLDHKIHKSNPHRLHHFATETKIDNGSRQRAEHPVAHRFRNAAGVGVHFPMLAYHSDRLYGECRARSHAIIVPCPSSPSCRRTEPWSSNPGICRIPNMASRTPFLMPV